MSKRWKCGDFAANAEENGDVNEVLSLDPENTNDGKDKGWAWVIAVCGMLVISVTFGVGGSYGVFLTYYLNNDVFPGARKIDYAFIGGLMFFFGQMLSPIIALCIDIFGARLLILLGILTHVAGYILASFSTQIWQLYLTQGVLPGVAVALVFLTVTLVLPTWFDRYLSSGMGIVTAGAGLGGWVSALYVNSLIKTTGDQKWALRAIAIVGFVVLFISSFILTPKNHKRIPLKSVSKQYLSTKAKKQFNLKVFKSYPLLLLALWFGLTYTAYVVLLFTLSPFAKKVGLTETQGTVISTVMNVFQMVGRPCMGLIGDRLGRYNLASLFNIIIVILVFAFWINATSYGALIAFSILTGLLVGVTPTMGQSLAANILQDSEKLPAAWSGMNIVSGIFTLFAEVIALALVDDDSSTPYLHTQIFTGVFYAVSFVLLLLIRERLVNRELQLISVNEVARDSNEKDIVNPQNPIVAFFLRMFYPMKV